MRKVKNDKAAAVSVLGMMLLVVIMVIGGGLFDFTKGFQLKRSYNDAAQLAAHSAIMHQHPRSGSLKVVESSAQAIVSYANLANSNTVKRNNALARCGNTKREITVYFATDRESARKYKKGAYDPSDRPDGVFKAVTFDLDKVPITSNFTQAVNNVKGQIQAQVGSQYNNNMFDTIILEVYETTPNTLLSAGTLASGDKKSADSLKCQRIGVTATATTYIENEVR